MLKKLLVPLDGSELAENALPYAKAMAEKFEGELILTMIVQPLPVTAMASHHGAPVLLHVPSTDAQLESAQNYLQELQNEFNQQAIPTRIKVLENVDVADGIINVAVEENVDAIVKTTHGRSGISRWIFGNVATRVLQEAPCPIFLVRVKGD